jgi:hypothetical protein
VNRTGFGIFFVSEASTAAPVGWPDGPADPAVVPLAPAPPAGVAAAGEDAAPEAEAPAEAEAEPDADADADAEAVDGVAEAAPDAGPSPALLTAVTVNVYVVPSDRFVTVVPVPVTPATRLPPW